MEFAAPGNYTQDCNHAGTNKLCIMQCITATERKTTDRPAWICGMATLGHDYRGWHGELLFSKKFPLSHWREAEWRQAVGLPVTSLHLGTKVGIGFRHILGANPSRTVTGFLFPILLFVKRAIIDSAPTQNAVYVNGEGTCIKCTSLPCPSRLDWPWATENVTLAEHTAQQVFGGSFPNRLFFLGCCSQKLPLLLQSVKNKLVCDSC